MKNYKWQETVTTKTYQSDMGTLVHTKVKRAPQHIYLSSGSADVFKDWGGGFNIKFKPRTWDERIGYFIAERVPWLMWVVEKLYKPNQ